MSRLHGHNRGRGRSSVSAGCQGWITHGGESLTLVITSDGGAGMSSFVGPQ